ncbi:MAG: DUF1801 domain-containing protein [Chloroflexota bacterium]|nr:DUF1801 domain-containing protein [Chloroflexota bacterium]
MRNTGYATVDEYIAAFPEDIRALLEAMRATIRAAAPDAGERISYQIPTFTLHGNLVHYAAFKRHIGFYPASSGIAAFQEELAGYKQSRGAVQFPLDQPLPLELVARITRFRADENRARAATKARAKQRDQAPT